ncbi:hypothetical protein O181_020089 [Austropuccinia psidii MF-1]|uniref:Uncharacterized protein n=1 Tax=Austropuccinia psidii MF-1 TaxID=1389203 RepID=A0A9Q3C896_9BASI|nr:hypothetical protein [Austropuccinia psidii MF-1]
MSTPLNQSEGIGDSKQQLFNFEKLQIKTQSSTSLHELKLSMGQALLKEVLKIEKWPQFSGQGGYDHIEFIRVISIIKEDFELVERLVKYIFTTLFTKSAHTWYIKLRQAHKHQR